VKEEGMEDYVSRINGMSEVEMDQLIKEGKCPYESERLVGQPLGMLHCPLCGEMVLAGVPHPRQSDLG